MGLLSPLLLVDVGDSQFTNVAWSSSCAKSSKYLQPDQPHCQPVQSRPYQQLPQLFDPPRKELTWLYWDRKTMCGQKTVLTSKEMS